MTRFARFLEACRLLGSSKPTVSSANIGISSNKRARTRKNKTSKNLRASISNKPQQH